MKRARSSPGAAGAPDRPRHVLHVFSVMDPGGAELRTLDVIRRLDQSRYATSIVTVSGRPGQLDAIVRDRGVTLLSARFDLAFPLRFARVLLRTRPDVVHSHIATNSGLPLAVARWMGVATRVAHFRSDGDPHGQGARRRLQRCAMRWLIDRSATAIVGVSPSALEYGWSSEWRSDVRCRVIANGLEVDALPSCGQRGEARARLGIDPHEVLIAHVARSTAEKNRLRALEVASAIHSRRCLGAFRLLLVGSMSDEERRQVEDRTVALGISDHVTVLGFRDDIPDLLMDADLLLVTSTREGLPGTVLEALAVGTAVVSSSVPGSCWIGELVAGVSIMDLAQSDAAWAARVELVVAAESGERRAAIRESFAQGPFRIERVLAELERVWAG